MKSKIARLRWHKAARSQSQIATADDDLVVGIEEIARLRKRSPRVIRGMIDAGQLPIFFASGVACTRKTLLREHDEQQAREYLDRVRQNAARGVKEPGRLKNVRAATTTPAPRPKSAAAE